MEEIDTDNIITGGRRTRGKVIDFAKAAENTKDLDEDEEDEDDDFEAPDEEMEGWRYAPSLKIANLLRNATD